MVQDSPLSETDQLILKLLQKDAKLSNAQLAEHTGLAPSTCHGRVRALERAGYITGYHASVNLEKIGLEVQALISLRVRQEYKSNFTQLMQRLSQHEEVRRIYLTSGDQDLLVEVAANSVAGLRNYIGTKLSPEPAVASNQTRIIFESWERF